MMKTTRRSTWLRALVMIGLALAPLTVQAQTPVIGTIISYQGLLTDNAGQPVADGSPSLTFKIYDGVTEVFTQTAPVATVGGVFNAFLSVGALQFDPTKAYDLGITYNAVEVKHPIAAVPVALNAKAATVATSANALRGVTVSATAPTDGQTLTYEAATTSWKPATPSGGASPYGYVYNTGAQVVAVGADVVLDTNGPLSGFSHTVGTTTITAFNAGVYKVSFNLTGVEPNQFAICVNGTPATGTLYGSGAGTQQNNGQAILVLAAGDVLTLRNNSSAAAVTLQTLAGGTSLNANASVLIHKIG